MPRTIDSLAARMKHARKMRGMTQADLAKASDMKQPDISKIERGQMLKTTGIARLAAALHVPPAWLESGVGEEPDWEAVAKAQAPGKLAHALILDARTVSLIEPKRLEWETSMTIEEVAALPRLFRLPMPDDAMKPKAPMGRWVAFEKADTADPGKRVLVRAADGRIYFRKYTVLETGGRWAAMPDNGSYPPLHSDSDGLKIIARMLYAESPDED